MKSFTLVFLSCLAGVLFVILNNAIGAPPPHELIQLGSVTGGETLWQPTRGADPIQNDGGDIVCLRGTREGNYSLYLWAAASRQFVDTTGLNQFLAAQGVSTGYWAPFAMNNGRHVLLLNEYITPNRMVLWRPDAPVESEKYVVLPTPPSTLLSAQINGGDRIVCYFSGSQSTAWQSIFFYTAPGNGEWTPLKAPSINPTTSGRPIYGYLTDAGEFVGYTYRGLDSAQYPVAWRWSPSLSEPIDFDLVETPSQSAITAIARDGDFSGYLKLDSDGSGYRLFIVQNGELVLSDFILQNSPGTLTMNSQGHVAFGSGIWQITQDGGFWQQAVHNLEPIAVNPINFKIKGFSDTDTLLGTATDEKGRNLACVWRPSSDPETTDWKVIRIYELIPAYLQYGIWPMGICANGCIVTRGTYQDDNYIVQMRPLSDSDEDGLPDTWEILSGTNPSVPDGHLHYDSDGLTNLEEYRAGTNPWSSDSDSDSLPDGWEVHKGYDPLNAEDANWDLDGDGMSTLLEYWAGSDPTGRYRIVEFGDVAEPMFYWLPPSPISLKTLSNEDVLTLSAGTHYQIFEDLSCDVSLRIRVDDESSAELLTILDPTVSPYYAISSYTTATNSVGTQVGYLGDDYWSAKPFLLFENASSFQDLIYGPPNRNTSTIWRAYSSGISDPTPSAVNGLVVGIDQIGYTGNSQMRGYRWNPATGEVIDIYPSQYPMGVRLLSSIGISPGGLIYGNFTDANQPRYDWHGFTYDGTEYRFLTLPGETNAVSSPPTPMTIVTVNRYGDILGQKYDMYYAEPGDRAFVWKSGESAPVYLQTLGGGSIYLTAMNDQRQVVGMGITTSGQGHAYLSQEINAGGQTIRMPLDLNMALPANSPWTISMANSINNRGDILARGYKAGESREYAILLRPIDQDIDNDGLPDDWEYTNFGNLDQTWWNDPDEDGVSNGDELYQGTSPVSQYSQGDTLPDNWSTYVTVQISLTRFGHDLRLVQASANRPLRLVSIYDIAKIGPRDGPFVTFGYFEATAKVDPEQPWWVVDMTTGQSSPLISQVNLRSWTWNRSFEDRDGDGLPDWYELICRTDLNRIDSDRDGLDDYRELYMGRNPLDGRAPGGAPVRLLIDYPALFD